MATNRITRGGATPPRAGAASRPLRLIVVIVAAMTLVAGAIGGCGGGSGSTDSSSAATGPNTAGSTEAAATGSSPEESADASILNTVLSRQEAAVGAYAATIPHLAPHLARTASYFRTQEQEHVDGVIKEMRALRIAAEPKEETIDPGEPKTDAERLVFLYEVENTTIADELSAIAKLESSTARSLLAATVANQAQHLTLLRRALGSGPLGSIPEPFENGTTEPPAK